MIFNIVNMMTNYFSLYIII